MKKLMAAAGLISALLTGTASASVTVNPQRVIFDGADRSAEITLANPTAERLAYRLEWIQLVMTPSGSLRAAKPGEAANGASEMVRFSPRQVVIEPGKSQKVRLSLRKPAGLPDGEYRSHLRIVTDKGVEQVPSAPPPSSPSGQEGMSINVILNYGSSIPVTVLNGSAKGGASLASVKAIKDAVAVQISRQGNASVVGDLVLMSNGREVARQLGIGVYANLSGREARIPFKGQAPKGSKVEYRDTESGQVLAAATLN